jgi:hypothetical protein
MNKKDTFRLLQDLSPMIKEIKITFNFNEYDLWEPNYNFVIVELPTGKMYNFPYVSRLHRWLVDSNLYKKGYATFMKDLREKAFKNLPPNVITCQILLNDFTVVYTILDT